MNLPSKRNKRAKITCASLTNLHSADKSARCRSLRFPMIAAWQEERHAFSHLFVNKSSWQASSTDARVLFSVPEHVLFTLLCTVSDMSLDTNIQSFCRNLPEFWTIRKPLSEWMVKKAILHKTWLEKHPKLAKTNCIGRWICLATTNCIGRWICLAMLEEKLQWTSLHLSDLSTTKMIHLETSSRILLIYITSQRTHHFGGKVNKDKKEVGKKFSNVALYLHFCMQKGMQKSHLLRSILNFMPQKRAFYWLQKIGFCILSAKSTFSAKTTKRKHLPPKNKVSGPKRPSIVATIVS